MATIDISSQSGAVGNGDLQLQNGAPMDGTLRFVTDALNTASPLKLSTSLVQTTSTLKITTNDNPYIDAEDGSGNNRFTVGRAPASQQVNVDFASNPTGSTTAVGAIRTYRDGTNLSEAMTFIEDGSVGIGTTAPVGILDLFKSAAATRLAIRGDAGQNRLISYRTGSLQRFGLYVNNTAESGANAGSDFAIRAYSDAGTLLSTPLFIQRSTGNIGIGTTTPLTARLVTAQGRVAISNASGANDSQLALYADGTTNGIYSTYNSTGSYLPMAFYTSDVERMRITAGGNVGIGLSTPTTKLEVESSEVTISRFVSTNAANTGEIAITSAGGAGNNTRGRIVGGYDAGGSGFGGFLAFNTTTTQNINNENVRITQAGNVGIGTTTPSSYGLLGIQALNVATKSAIGIGVGANGSNASPYTTAMIEAFTTGGTVPCGMYSINTYNDNTRNEISFRTTSTGGTTAERLRITQDGITFNGDTAAANALDDYEEGTWTMGIAFGGASTGITYIANTGTYTKIGRQVTVNGYVLLSSKGSSTGSATITGLPFTIAGGNPFSTSASLWVRNISFLNQFQAIGTTTSTTISLWEVTNLGSLSALDDTNFANDSDIVLSFTYFV